MRNFNNLPFEIMLEIFSRVPTESVIGCKMVSKRWRNLLQHPSFSQMHLNHLNYLDSTHDSGKLSFIFDTHGSDLEHFCYSEYDETLNRFTGTKRVDLRPPFEDRYILGSCNGLLCFNAYFDRCYPQPAYICNPITREYIVLPKFEGNAFLLSGFGYSSSTDEYKVVRICTSSKDPSYGIVQVYTLGSDIGWRKGKKMDYDVISFSQPGVFANGDIHWVNHRGTIVAFDLVDEEFRKLTSPPYKPLSIVGLHVLGDFLCASYKHAEGLDLWVLEKNERNHDVVWSIELSNINVKPITFTRSGGLFLCYDYCDKNVYRYAPKTSSSRMLVNSGNYFVNGISHRNTLVSLKALGEGDTKIMDSGERARFSRETEISDH